jgi:hypothetical protein
MSHLRIVKAENILGDGSGECGVTEVLLYGVDGCLCGYVKSDGQRFVVDSSFHPESGHAQSKNANANSNSNACSSASVSRLFTPPFLFCTLACQLDAELFVAFYNPFSRLFLSLSTSDSPILKGRPFPFQEEFFRFPLKGNLQISREHRVSVTQKADKMYLSSAIGLSYRPFDVVSLFVPQSFSSSRYREVEEVLRTENRDGLRDILKECEGHEGALSVLQTALFLRGDQSSWIVPVLFGDVTDVNQSCQRGHTAAHVAAAYGCGVTLTALLKCGAAMDSPDDDGRTPFHFLMQSVPRASHRDDLTAIVRDLLSSRPSLISLRDHRGVTPLHIACLNSFLSSFLIPLLLFKDAEMTVSRDCLPLDIPDDSGHTPIQIAYQKRDIQSFRLFVRCGSPLPAPLRISMVGIGDDEFLQSAREDLLRHAVGTSSLNLSHLDLDRIPHTHSPLKIRSLAISYNRLESLDGLEAYGADVRKLTVTDNLISAWPSQLWNLKLLHVGAFHGVHSTII